jgi:hypothetical protein
MKKSVRNIVSLITSTCLVASMSAVSISADELVQIESSNDTVVEQSSANNTVASTATKSASTADDSSSVVASNSSSNSEGSVDVTVAAESNDTATVTNNVLSALSTDDDSDVAVPEDIEDDIDLESDDEVVDEDLAEEGESALGVTTTTSSASSSTGSATNSSTTSNDVVIPIFTDCVSVEITNAVTEAVEEAPVTKDVILTLDTSNSMNGQPKELVRETATNLVTKILSNDENARIALVGFNGYAYHLSVYDEETDEYITYFDNADDLIAAINDMLDDDTVGDGSTDLLDALYEVQFLLQTSDGDEKSVVIMTDGAQGTNLIDDDGNVDYDIANRYVFGEDYATDQKDSIIQFANDELKPLATIYAVGYFQNLSKDEAADSRDFLQELASDGEDGTRYYEANDKNIDEITDLITQDIVHKAIKDAPAAKSDSSSSSSSDSSDSPKTSDAGVAPVMMVSALAGAMLLLTKKKNK